MTRTVIAFQELLDPDSGEKKLIFHIEEPTNVPDFDVSCPFEVRGAARGGVREDPVRATGDQLREELYKHRGVENALERVLNDETIVRGPIYLRTAASAEAIAWESLHHPIRHFLALDDRWPIARIVGRSYRQEVLERAFQSPLRVCAVLAAKDRDAEPEWQALRQALRASGLPCRLDLFVCQRDLKELIEGDDIPNVETAVGFVPDDAEDLIAALGEARPHLVHFFCHGSAEYAGYLEIGTLLATEAGAEPLCLKPTDIANLKTCVWLISLNACEGAMPFQGAHSLAHSLVREGVPAVFGMREAVDHTDAHRFCGGMFEAVLEYLSGALEAEGTVDIDWCGIQRRPRRAITKRHPGPVDNVAARHPQWTLPVLYVRPETLRVRVAGAAAVVDEDELRFNLSLLEQLRSFREELHADTPAENRTLLEQGIAQLEVDIGSWPG